MFDQIHQDRMHNEAQCVVCAVSYLTKVCMLGCCICQLSEDWFYEATREAVRLSELKPQLVNYKNPRRLYK